MLSIRLQKPEAREEFLKVMEIDAVGSRKEEGCLRFDVMCDQSNPDRFFFYEVTRLRLQSALYLLVHSEFTSALSIVLSQVYKDADAIAVHKEQPHFKVWSDFKANGGVISQTSTKTDFPFESAFVS